MAWYLDGRAQAVWGTHTHVPTADCQLLPKGTGFVTDLGMTGPYRSVLGIRPEHSMNLFLGGLPRRYEGGGGPLQAGGLPLHHRHGEEAVRGGAPGGPLGVMPADRPILNDQERNGTMLKVLHGADFHLDSPFSGLKPDAAARRRGEQRELLARLTDLAREREADLVLPLRGPAGRGPGVPGDRPGPGPGPGRDPLPCIPGPGQPRLVRSPVPYAALEWPGNVHLFTGPELGGSAAAGAGLYGVGSGLLRPRQSASPAGLSCPGGGGPAGRPSHGEVAAQGTTAPSREEDIAASGLDYLALGHVHQYSGLRRAGETFWAYPGCPEGRGFDELGEKGVLWLEVEKGRTEAEFVPLCRRRYQILSVDLTGQADPAAAVLAALPPQTGEDIYRLPPSPGSGDWRGWIWGSWERELSPGSGGLTLRDHTRAARALWEREGGGHPHRPVPPGDGGALSGGAGE